MVLGADEGPWRRCAAAVSISEAVREASSTPDVDPSTLTGQVAGAVRLVCGGVHLKAPGVRRRSNYLVDRQARRGLPSRWQAAPVTDDVQPTLRARDRDVERVRVVGRPRELPGREGFRRGTSATGGSGRLALQRALFPQVTPLAPSPLPRRGEGRSQPRDGLMAEVAFGDRLSRQVGGARLSAALAPSAGTQLALCSCVERTSTHWLATRWRVVRVRASGESSARRTLSSSPPREHRLVAWAVHTQRCADPETVSAAASARRDRRTCRGSPRGRRTLLDGLPARRPRLLDAVEVAQVCLCAVQHGDDWLELERVANGDDPLRPRRSHRPPAEARPGPLRRRAASPAAGRRGRGPAPSWREGRRRLSGRGGISRPRCRARLQVGVGGALERLVNGGVQAVAAAQVRLEQETSSCRSARKTSVRAVFHAASSHGAASSRSWLLCTPRVVGDARFRAGPDLLHRGSGIRGLEHLPAGESLRPGLLGRASAAATTWHRRASAARSCASSSWVCRCSRGERFVLGVPSTDRCPKVKMISIAPASAGDASRGVHVPYWRRRSPHVQHHRRSECRPAGPSCP